MVRFHLSRSYLAYLLPDVRYQLPFHIVMATVWFGGMIAIPFVPEFSNTATMILVEVSMYTNWVGEMKAISSFRADQYHRQQSISNG